MKRYAKDLQCTGKGMPPMESVLATGPEVAAWDACELALLAPAAFSHNKRPCLWPGVFATASVPHFSDPYLSG